MDEAKSRAFQGKFVRGMSAKTGEGRQLESAHTCTRNVAGTINSQVVDYTSTCTEGCQNLRVEEMVKIILCIVATPQHFPLCGVNDQRNAQFL